MFIDLLHGQPRLGGERDNFIFWGIYGPLGLHTAAPIVTVVAAHGDRHHKVARRIRPLPDTLRDVDSVY
jgi:hypothetical protein